MNVLLIEDDRNFRVGLGSMLERTGRTVSFAATVEEGLLKSPHADVILLDLKLGNESGEDFLEKLRAAGEMTPVIVLSAIYPKATAAPRLRKYEIVDFIEKPFKMADLVVKLGAAERLVANMHDMAESAERFKKATTNLRKICGKSITELGAAGAGL